MRDAALLMNSSCGFPRLLMGYFLSRHDSQSLFTHSLARNETRSIAPVNRTFTCQSADRTVSNKLEAILCKVEFSPVINDLLHCNVEPAMI